MNRPRRKTAVAKKNFGQIGLRAAKKATAKNAPAAVKLACLPGCPCCTGDPLTTSDVVI